MIKCGVFNSSLCSPLENCPCVEIPFSCSTALAVLSMKPSGVTPALSGAMMSPCAWRAMASAIWLRTQFPTQTKSTRIGSPMVPKECHNWRGLVRLEAGKFGGRLEAIGEWRAGEQSSTGAQRRKRSHDSHNCRTVIRAIILSAAKDLIHAATPQPLRRRPPRHLHKIFVNGGVFRQFRMERRGENIL